MAITIENSPQTYSPVFNPMRFVCSSNNIAGQNFFFYLIRVKDSSGTTIHQERQIPRYDNDYLLFDVARVLEKYTTYDISGITGGTTGVRKTSNVFKEYTVQFIEEYGATASGVASGSTATSSTGYAYNGVFTDEVFNSFDDSDYLIQTTGTNKFLTDFRGGNIRIKSGQRFELGWITSAGVSEPSKSVVIKTYNSAGTNLGTYKIANTFSAGTTTADKFLSVLVGTGDLNSTTLSSGSQPIITDSVDTYQVYIENNSSTRVSEIITFEIDRECYKTDEIRLHWVNSLGRIDSFNFNFASERSKDVKQSRFRRDRGSFSGSVFSTTNHEFGLTNFYTQSDRKIKVRTDYINNTEAVWLENLIDSPQICGEVDGKYIPLLMDTTTYRRQTIELNKLFSVEFDLSYSVSSYRQR